MGSRRAVVFLTVLGLALAGCGEDDDNASDDAAESTVDAGVATQQDAGAKADARELVTFVEACFIDQQDYTRCLDAAGTEDVGEATIEASAPGGYVVISPSESGNEFRIEKAASSTLQRTCEEPGSGGCPASGRW